MRRLRKPHPRRFVDVVYVVGAILVGTFLLWAFLLVILQALEQWRR
ncbi:hypothetical protein H7849_13460 [Alloacidobacterium dinghuense]|uniref:Uncharacterized protein n=1 Tax=Alloacidobacterium dinghuense TaxID=2763107 RepID=A0A7G8BCC9_9BACT|nr:hypothetical protein [Alloacidobacterium dinghuense]QNI30199.1 hypothetical protein H7849_13460 [Alloacidobacterium dinghuense]